MPARLFRLLWVGILLWYAVYLPSSHPVRAAISGCSASLSTGSFDENSSTALTVSVTNDDPEIPVTWVQVSVPSQAYTLTGASSSWSQSVEDASIVFSDGDLGPGETETFTVNLTTGGSEGSNDWSVEASDQSGSDQLACGGSLATVITSDGGGSGDTGGGDTTAPSISSVTIGNITGSSLTLTASVSESSAAVLEYGTTTSYGSSVSSTTSSITHVFGLTGLTANTTYHFRVTATDAASNSGVTTDQTFTTALAGQTITETVTRTVTSTTTVTTTVVKLIEDTIPPNVTVAGDFDGTFSDIPTVTGSVTDNVGITDIQYSIDGGNSWTSVDEMILSGKKSARFSFRPEYLLDGNWPVVVRAHDYAGNTGRSRTRTLIYDRLPPATGPVMVTDGNQTIEPDQNGTYLFLPFVPYAISVSAVGGPTELTARFRRVPGGSDEGESDNDVINRVFGYKPALGVWQTTVTFFEPGLHDWTISGRDGAGKSSTRTYRSLRVTDAGRVTDRTGQPIADATVTLLISDPNTGKFIAWNGDPYGINNPQVTGPDGYFGFTAYPGTYAVKVEAGGYRTYLSPAFTLDRTRPISSPVQLQTVPTIGFGQFRIALPIPFIPSLEPFSFTHESQPVPVPVPSAPLVFITPSGDHLYSTKFRGKPTIVSFLNTWSPTAADQLAALSALAANPRVSVYGVYVQASASRLMAISQTVDVGLPILGDPDGIAAQALGVFSSPTHVIFDRLGTPVRVIAGTLDTDELEHLSID